LRVRVACGMRVFTWHIVAYNYAICSCGIWRVACVCHVHVRMCHVACVAFGHNVHVEDAACHMGHAHVACGHVSIMCHVLVWHALVWHFVYLLYMRRGCLE
jgi:hypothetical protein